MRQLRKRAQLYARRALSNHSQIAERLERTRVLDELRDKVRPRVAAPCVEYTHPSHQRRAHLTTSSAPNAGAAVLQVEQLTYALSRRASEARANTKAHRAALVAVALAAALEDGRPITPELQVCAGSRLSPAQPFAWNDGRRLASSILLSCPLLAHVIRPMSSLWWLHPNRRNCGRCAWTTQWCRSWRHLWTSLAQVGLLWKVTSQFVQRSALHLRTLVWAGSLHLSTCLAFFTGVVTRAELEERFERVAR